MHERGNLVLKSPPVFFALQLRKRRQHGEMIKDLMADYGLSKASVYRYLGKTA
jgi:hypothetical protein